VHLEGVARARYRLGTSRFALALGPLRARFELRRAAARARTVEEIVDAAFAPRHGSLPLAPAQVRREVTAFVERVRDEHPRRVLEIGTGHGATLYLLAWASAPDARLLSLDNRDFSARRRLYRSFARKGQQVQVMLCDSHTVESRNAVRTFFGGEPVDVLFIDGDHSYDGVRRDYELYSPFVRSGGLIAFHDIVDGSESFVGGVPRFWRELKPTLGEVVELVESWSQGGYGIGLARTQRQGEPPD
jgi:predicted O-methyltransferase YrrM